MNLAQEHRENQTIRAVFVSSLRSTPCRHLIDWWITKRLEIFETVCANVIDQQHSQHWIRWNLIKSRTAERSMPVSILSLATITSGLIWLSSSLSLSPCVQASAVWYFSCLRITNNDLLRFLCQSLLSGREKELVKQKWWGDNDCPSFNANSHCWPSVFEGNQAWTLLSWWSISSL